MQLKAHQLAVQKKTREDFFSVTKSPFRFAMGRYRKKDKKNLTGYNGSFTQTTVPGIYNAKIKLRGVGKICGDFQRTISKTFYVTKAGKGGKKAAGKI